MRRTDFCHLTSSYEHPCLVGSRFVRELALLALRGVACHHVRAIRFGGPHQGHLSTARGVVFPSWRVRSSLWHPCRVSHVGPFARAMKLQWKLPRSPPRRARVKDEACGMSDPRCLPSGENLCPATPFRAPGSGHRSRPAWPPRRDRPAPFHPSGLLRARRGQAPVHAPRCRGYALLWASALLADFCNLKTTHGHTRRALDPRTRVGQGCPAARRHQPMPVALAPRRVAAPHDLRATTSTACGCTPRPTRVGHAGRGPGRRSKGEWPCRERRWAALLAALRAPGSPARGGTRVGARVRAFLLVEIHVGRRLAKGRRPRENRGAFVRHEIHFTPGGLLPPAGWDRASLTPPPWRHCSGGRAPFGPCQRRLAPTSQAVDAARPAGRQEPRPPEPSGAQRP
jgi:hypothetical protein